MTTVAIRKSLFEYIRFADEKKVKALFTIVEDEINEKHEIWNNEFLKEIQKRSRELENIKSKGNDLITVQSKAKKILSKAK